MGCLRAGVLTVSSLALILIVGVISKILSGESNTVDYMILAGSIIAGIICIVVYDYIGDEDTPKQRPYTPPSGTSSTTTTKYTRGEPGSATNKDQSTKGDTGPGSVGGGGGKSSRY